MVVQGFNPAYLAIDLGGTKIAYRLIYFDDKKAPVYRDFIYQIPFVNEPGIELQQCLLPVHELLHINELKIMRVSIASAASINNQGIISRWPSTPAWEGIPFKSIISEQLECSNIQIFDDCNMAAYAEAHYFNVDSAIYIGIGTGIGGGIILDRKPFLGVNRCAAEIGHMIVQPDGPVCSCGRKGCLQSIASGRKIGQALTTFTQGNIQQHQEPIKSAVSALAQSIIILSELIDPQMIIFGGGIIARYPILLEWVKTQVNTYTRKGQILPQIVPAFYGHKSALEGATLTSISGEESQY